MTAVYWSFEQQEQAVNASLVLVWLSFLRCAQDFAFSASAECCSASGRAWSR